MNGINYAPNDALIVVDVQPEYWSSSSADVATSFPEFPLKLQRCLSWARSRKLLVIWVRCEYNSSNSPWLGNFAQLNPEKQSTIIFDPEDLSWEDFAVPIRGEAMVVKVREANEGAPGDGN